MSTEIPGSQPSRPSQLVAGVVLAGGRSVRFGGEKAAAQLAGRPLLMWAAERLKNSCAAVAVNARPGTEAQALAQAAGLPILHDEAGDAAGPLAGVKVGLSWAQSLGARSLAVSPCDAPLLPADLFVRLIAAAGAGAAMAETSDGRQPLCAVWPVSALSTVVAALAGGAHPPTWRVLETVGAQRVHFEPAEAFANLNTRADLAAIAARVARGELDLDRR
jgi:molybdenum cofactor guanylyltransferase